MSIDPFQLPASPRVVAPFVSALAGVDFLNLRQVNLDLMAECIPGTGNSTKLVRGYSLIAWIYWIFPKLVAANEGKEFSKQTMVYFREKVESLFVWGHKLEDFEGVPGISSEVPDDDGGLVDLRFDAWKRSRANTSLEAAVQYGPSLLPDGLGFIEKVENDVYRVTPAGRKLGKALDKCLRRSPAYGFLTDITSLSGTAQQAGDLFDCWRIDETSEEEAEAFRAALWNADWGGQRTTRARRSDFIGLLLAVIGESEDPPDLDHIRHSLAFPTMVPEERMTPGMLRQSRSWLVLQLRQLERQSLESIMSWVEEKLVSGRPKLPDDLVETATAAVCAEFGFAENATVAACLAEVHGPYSSVAGFETDTRLAPDWVSPWHLLQELKTAMKGDPDTCLTTGFYNLLLLYQCRPFLEADERCAKHLDRGGVARLGLAHWFATVERFRTGTIGSLIGWTLKNLIISQHLAVGTQRFDGKKIRLRMILEEEGLVRLFKKRWEPEPTPDRLRSLLSLLRSCHVVTEDANGGFQLV